MVVSSSSRRPWTSALRSSVRARCPVKSDRKEKLGETHRRLLPEGSALIARNQEPDDPIDLGWLVSARLGRVFSKTRRGGASGTLERR